MINQRLPKFKDLNKFEKVIMIMTIVMTIVSVIILILCKTKVIKNNVWPFSFAFVYLLMLALYFKHNRFISIITFLFMLLFIGYGLTELGL